MKQLGILGGGQLGRMLALAARRFALRVITLDPEPNSPCGQVADEQIIAAYDDGDAVAAFARRCDVLTFEFENIPQATVAALEAAGVRIAPGSQVLATTQDRLVEKDFVRSCGFQTAPYAAISSSDDVAKALRDVGLPAIAKTRRGGYDGKGQWRVTSAAQLEHICREAVIRRGEGKAGIILEGLVRFEREASVIATRDAGGQFIFFPIAENIHKDGILATTIVPACISAAAQTELERIARAIGDGLRIVGTFAVEAFISGDTVLVNEIAPRVHNSGHYTLEATSLSQFEAHIRAVTGLPLVTPRLLSPAVMINLLGTGTGDAPAGLEQLLALDETTLHLYGKTKAAAGRKMGHITVLGPDRETALARAAAARTKLTWR